MAVRLGCCCLALAGVLGCAPRPTPATQIEPEGLVNVPGGRVAYRIMGGGDKTPLVLLHGGPGGRSCTFSVLSELATDRRVILYDQLGSGRSDRPNDVALWRMDRFVEELDAVRRALGLREVHILGHSWGGTLATEYLLTKGRQGVRSVILSSPLISTPRWLADTRRLRLTLPEPVQSALNKCEAVETADDPACVAANDVFEEHFVRGAKALPDVPECEGVTGGDEVYRHMWGAGEFTATGLLRDYDRTDRLGELQLPVLFLAGRHDEAVPATVADFQRRVPAARMHVFENSAHATYRTETAEYVRIVRDFLAEAEANGGPTAAPPIPQDPAPQRREFSLPATKARGLPLADAVLVGNTLYISGRGGVDLATMKVPADVKDEVKLMMEDYKAILAMAGMTMDDLVSVTIYSPDLSLYSTFNEIYRSYFTRGFPARAFIGSGPLLFGMRFEMQAIAIKR